ncbi:dihydrofolate reductase [Streptomonospora sp. PA3]|uniref:dihydrofolate reductase family protein n=1 Tax=Streptomonospora sp. PA3 TaxID=2607326 RepID=UPI0012DEC754|nr:dihydrofolate reductase family protein [Streptomonospora sp. PA3]MUL40408.1 dihydrofolate reductase [Streptomonospora sp. PA3]
MGNLVVSEFLALNGVMEAPEKWSLDYFDDGIAEFKLAEILSGGALLLGRRTYDGFAAAWPGRTDETGFADKINEMPKYVVSSRGDAPWRNTTVIGPDFAEPVAALKAEVAGDILVNGSGELVDGLLAEGLVDRLTLITYPVMPASGKRLFADGTAAELELIETREFAGPVLSTYAVRK